MNQLPMPAGESVTPEHLEEIGIEPVAPALLEVVPEPDKLGLAARLSARAAAFREETDLKQAVFRIKAGQVLRTFKEEGKGLPLHQKVLAAAGIGVNAFERIKGPYAILAPYLFHEFVVTRSAEIPAAIGAPGLGVIALASGATGAVATYKFPNTFHKTKKYFPKFVGLWKDSLPGVNVPPKEERIERTRLQRTWDRGKLVLPRGLTSTIAGPMPYVMTSEAEGQSHEYAQRMVANIGLFDTPIAMFGFMEGVGHILLKIAAYDHNAITEAEHIIGNRLVQFGGAAGIMATTLVVKSPSVQRAKHEIWKELRDTFMMRRLEEPEASDKPEIAETGTHSRLPVLGSLALAGEIE